MIGTTNVIMARKSYDFSMEILSLVARIAMTICIEILIAFLFGYRDKESMKIIGITNAFTQIVLNLLLNMVNYRSGEWAFIFHYVWMELVVFTIEAVIYKKSITKVDGMTGKVRYPVIYAALANLMSFIVGIWIAKIISGIF